MSDIIRITDLPQDNNPIKTHAIPMVNLTADTTVQSSIEEMAPALLSSGADVYTNQISGYTTSGITIPDKLIQGVSGFSYGDYSVSQGYINIAEGNYSHAEGSGALALGDYSHTEGQNTRSSNVTNVINSTISNLGVLVIAGDYSTTFIDGVITWGVSFLNVPISRLVVSGNSTFDGTNTTITFDPIYSGTSVYRLTTRNGDYSHAEGFNTSSEGGYSHAEGHSTTASGIASHSEGRSTQSNAPYSHAEGRETKTNALYSHTEGYGTVADGSYQHVSGKFNTTGDTTSLVIIGCGTSDSDRADALKVVQISGTTATTQMQQVVYLNFSGDTDASNYGVPIGGIYHDNGILRIRLT